MRVLSAGVTLPLWLVLCALTGCARQLSAPEDMVELSFGFEAGPEDWRGAFADYPSGREQDFRLTFEHRALPGELAPQGKALYLAGDNRSDDLFMFLTREVTGLRPQASYAVTFELVLASNAGSGCAGIGGAPGESVYLKAGASSTEPRAIADADGSLRLNVDKGIQSSGGANAQVLGNIANGLPECSPEAPFRLITRSNAGNPLLTTTDERGALWLLVGTDSGFEGTTVLYYDTIRVTLEPR
jgi:hypothetical protein